MLNTSVTFFEKNQEKDNEVNEKEEKDNEANEKEEKDNEANEKEKKLEQEEKEIGKKIAEEEAANSVEARRYSFELVFGIQVHLLYQISYELPVTL
jgi:FtsZ-interacting cell division protein YlmF